MNRKTAKNIVLLLISFFTATNTFAQRGANQKQEIRQEQIKRIQAAKWSYIIYRLNLNEERSNRLLPIYQAYESELRTALAAWYGPNGYDVKTMSDASADSLLSQKMEFAKKNLALEEKYNPQFLTVLSPKELLILQEARREFWRKIMQRKTLRQMNQNKGFKWDE